jgi:hypothetical protein
MPQRIAPSGALLLVALTVGALACRELPPEEGDTDAGAGVTDAGPRDAGGGDPGATTDGGVGDAGTGADAGADPDAGVDAGVDAGADAGVDAGVCVPATCNGRTYACGDCVDNDGDGRRDSADPECLGPCQDREEGFDPQLPGMPTLTCSSTRDCFFDHDTGNGNDGCRSDVRCDPLQPDPSCTPGGATCPGTQSAACLQTCGALTPAGCDCFGCCGVVLPDGGTRNVSLASETANAAAGISAPACSLATAGDTTACRACTPNPGCLEPCGPCQLCPGKTSLPAGCSAADRCPGGEAPCGQPGDAACAEGAFCQLGCCVQG